MFNKTINGYTIERKLGEGGMAEVWYAENEIGKAASVKLLKEKFCKDEVIVDRFRNEAKVMVKLNHPNIRQVYDYKEIKGQPCIIMEYLEGDDLKARMLKGEHFSENRLCLWWNQLVDALDHTHQQGVIHRDIKPSNIFIDKYDNVRLMDFGIAKTEEYGGHTQTGVAMGTRIYMSPEQVRDPKRVTEATDAYSLAVTFVHLLTGKAPYDTTTNSDFDIQMAIVQKPLDMTGVSTEWRTFLQPYLEKEPAKRSILHSFTTTKNQVKISAGKIENGKSEGAADQTVVEGKVFSGQSDVKSLSSKNRNNQSVSKRLEDEREQRRREEEAWRKAQEEKRKKKVSKETDTEGLDSIMNRKSIRKPKRGGLLLWVLGGVVVIAIIVFVILRLTVVHNKRDSIEDVIVEYTPPEPITYTIPKEPVQVKKFAVNGVTFTMVKVEGGTFRMGATLEQEWRGAWPVHEVSLSDFWIGETEVTQGLWQAVMGVSLKQIINHYHIKKPFNIYNDGENYPMQFVSYEDALEFCNVLSDILKERLPEGFYFSLPTEAEWEYAARGGNRSQGYKYSGSNDLNDIAWYWDRLKPSVENPPHLVKTKNANELGLYDMSGNVWEWCKDAYEPYDEMPQTDPQGPMPQANSGKALLRGGSAHYDSVFCCVSYRHTCDPNCIINDIGFRVVLVRR